MDRRVSRHRLFSIHILSLSSSINPFFARACAKNLKVLPYFTVLVDVSVELGMQNPHFQSLLTVIVSFAIYIADFSIDHGLVV